MSYKDRNFKSDYNRYTTLSQSFLITELVKKPQILLCVRFTDIISTFVQLNSCFSYGLKYAL